MLVYVEPVLTQQVANNLFISEKSTSFRGGVTIGVPALNFELMREVTSSDRPSLLMPETLAQFIQKKLTVQSVRDTLSTIRAVEDSGERKIVPGNVLLVTGTLAFPGASDLTDFNPLEPPELNLKQFRLHGEDVLVASLREDPFFIPVYFPYIARNHVPYANGQDVTVLGVCKWVPPYRPGSGSPVELAIRASALWIN